MHGQSDLLGTYQISVVFLTLSLQLYTMCRPLPSSLPWFSQLQWVIFLVARHKVLHQMTFYLALQIIVAHLIFSVTVLPFIFVTAILREWHLGLVISGVARGVHVGSLAPNPCTCAPILCMTLCIFVEPVTVCIIFHYTVTANDVTCHVQSNL